MESTLRPGHPRGGRRHHRRRPAEIRLRGLQPGQARGSRRGGRHRRAHRRPAAVLVNTCYSHVGRDYGISVAHVVRPQGNLFVEVQGSGGVSAPNDAEARKRESAYADGWYDAITAAIWGTARV